MYSLEAIRHMNSPAEVKKLRTLAMAFNRVGESPKNAEKGRPAKRRKKKLDVRKKSCTSILKVKPSSELLTKGSSNSSESKLKAGAKQRRRQSR